MGITIGKAFDEVTVSALRSALNVEMGALGRELAASSATVPAMLQSVQKALRSGGTTSTTSAIALEGERLSQVVAKIVFVSVLTDAISKASRSSHFNVETAINDLWVHLNSTRRLSSGGDNTAPGIGVETQHLRRMIEKRAGLFSALSAVMKTKHDTAKNAIQNMR